MAGFCTNCGAPLAGAFCGRCGQRAESASAPAQSPAPTAPPATVTPSRPATATPQPTVASQPVAPAPPSATVQAPAGAPPSAQPSAPAPPKSSGGGKALLIVGGIVLLLVLSAFGAVLYGVHWVKHKVSSITGGSFGTEVSQGNMCKLLSTGELQQMIGVAVERSAEIMDNGDPGCAYYTNPAAFAELQKIAIARPSEIPKEPPSILT